MSGSNKMKEVLFDLTDDALYVANGGHPFSRRGVIGICASHISEKADVASDNYPDRDEDLVSAIQKREMTTYKNDSNRLTSDSRGEREISYDYGGRFIWELLQNVDDALGPNDRTNADLIGSKGLGFKSVLEVTEAPEIHSGPFRFKFSPDETQKILKGEGIHENPPRLAFRIPHPCQLDRAPIMPPFMSRVCWGYGPVWTGLQTPVGSVRRGSYGAARCCSRAASAR